MNPFIVISDDYEPAGSGPLSKAVIKLAQEVERETLRAICTYNAKNWGYSNFNAHPDGTRGIRVRFDIDFDAKWSIGARIKWRDVIGCDYDDDGRAQQRENLAKGIAVAKEMIVGLQSEIDRMEKKRSKL